MTFVNLTPHAITVVLDNTSVQFPASGNVARVSTSRVSGPTLTAYNSVSIQTSRVEFGAVEGLPDPVDGTVYIVSGMVAARVNRPDVFAPGELVRDANGQPIGCKGLTCSG
jgi:hypothetical protein